MREPVVVDRIGPRLKRRQAGIAFSAGTVLDYVPFPNANPSGAAPDSFSMTPEDALDRNPTIYQVTLNVTAVNDAQTASNNGGVGMTVSCAPATSGETLVPAHLTTVSRTLAGSCSRCA